MQSVANDGALRSSELHGALLYKVDFLSFLSHSTPTPLSDDTSNDTLNGITELLPPNSIQSSKDEVDATTQETTTILSSAAASATVGVISAIGSGHHPRVRPSTTRSGEAAVEVNDPFNSALPLTELVVIGEACTVG